jgi:phosphatidylglycerol:prolipoprotein diacylglycerol transferase
VRPELFRIADVSFPAYFVLLITGFAFAAALAVLWARRIGEDPDVIVDLALASLLLGVAGGRVFHVLFDGYFWDYVHLCTDPGRVDWKITEAACVSDRYRGVWDASKGVCHPGEADCFAWAKFWAGGLTYYGGLVFGVVGGVLLCRRDRFPVWKAADLAGVAIPAGIGFARTGCLLAGCCFGRAWDGPLALAFPPRSPASEAQFKAGELAASTMTSLPVHPTQAYESVFAFALGIFCLCVVQPRKRYDGEVLLWSLGLYAAGRFLLELLRADDRGGIAALSTSQLIGLGIVAAVLVLHRRRMRARRPCS